jgi:hypothetical protein
MFSWPFGPRSIQGDDDTARRRAVIGELRERRFTFRIPQCAIRN